MRCLAAILALVVVAASAAQDLAPLPELRGRVTDTAGVLKPAQVTVLEQKLAAFEARKGSQIAVVLVPTTAPESIEAYSIRLAEKAKVGRRNADDGVIILVALQDQKSRIEVGYGLEGVIPDSVAYRVRTGVMNPHFRAGNLYEGLAAGTDALIGLINGEALPAPAPDARARWVDQGSDYEGYFVLLVMLVVVVGGVLKAILGRLAGSAVVGGIAGVATWLVSSTLAVGLIAGIAAFIFSLVLGGAMGGRPGTWTGGRRRGGGILPPGSGWPGGNGSWSGGGSGGWSGGGGGFGGGGSSGGWND